MKKVKIDTAQDVSGKHLTKWLEMRFDNTRMNFRYGKFVSTQEAERIENIIVNTNDDSSWAEALEIIKPHINEIVQGAKELKNSDDVMAMLGNQTYMFL